MREQDRNTYGTEVFPEADEPLEPEVRDKFALAGAPIWVVVGVVFFVLFVVLLLSWPLFVR